MILRGVLQKEKPGKIQASFECEKIPPVRITGPLQIFCAFKMWLCTPLLLLVAKVTY